MQNTIFVDSENKAEKNYHNVVDINFEDKIDNTKKILGDNLVFNGEQLDKDLEAISIQFNQKVNKSDEPFAMFIAAAGRVSQLFQNVIYDYNECHAEIIKWEKEEIQQNNDDINKYQERIRKINNILDSSEIKYEEIIEELFLQKCSNSDLIEVNQKKLDEIKVKLDKFNKELEQLDIDVSMENEPICEKIIRVKDATSDNILDDFYNIEYKGEFDKILKDFTSQYMVTDNLYEIIDNKQKFRFISDEERPNTGEAGEYKARIEPGFIPKHISTIAKVSGITLGGAICGGLGLATSNIGLATIGIVGGAGLGAKAAKELKILYFEKQYRDYYNFEINFKFCKVKKNYYCQKIQKLKIKISELHLSKEQITKVIKTLEIERQWLNSQIDKENLSKINNNLQDDGVRLLKAILNKILENSKIISDENAKLQLNILRLKEKLEDSKHLLSKIKAETLYRTIKSLEKESEWIAPKGGDLEVFMKCYTEFYENNSTLNRFYTHSSGLYFSQNCYNSQSSVTPILSTSEAEQVENNNQERLCGLSFSL